MINQPLDELYFQWLYSQVADPNTEEPYLSYWKLLRYFFTRKFEWQIPRDENRAADGKELRYEFVHDSNLSMVDHEWLHMDCSMLELMVGLSRRLSFEADGEPHYWFWRLMENIGLNGYSDDRQIPVRKIENTLDRVIFRQYKSSGLGGFFPLKHADRDQRKAELWVQLCAYVNEQS